MDELQVVSNKILNLPGRPPFMLDSELAGLYGSKTKRVNQAVRRNPERFPEDFVFQLSAEEVAQLEVTDCDLKFAPGKPVADCDHLKNPGSEVVTDCDQSGNYGGRRHLPFGFTREGCNMLSAVLSTPIAIDRSVQIMRAFSAMEQVHAKPDAPASPLLPNGWQMHELRKTYGAERAQRILKDMYGIGPDIYRTDISPYEAKVVDVNNPNVGHRNHMIFQLAERGVLKGRIAEMSGISRQSILNIYNKVRRLRSLM